MAGPEVIGIVELPLLDETDTWDIMTREEIEEDFADEYDWTGREHLLWWVKAVNLFDENFKDRIYGYLVESDDSGDVLRISALTRGEGQTLELIDIVEWLKAKGVKLD